MIYTPNLPPSAIHRQARALELGRAEPTGDAIIAEAGKGETKNYCRKRKACRVPKPSQDTCEWRQANHDGECVRSDLRETLGVLGSWRTSPITTGGSKLGENLG